MVADLNNALRSNLREALSERRALLVPGAANALTALIAEQLGFEAVYVTGAGIANTGFGIPDIGLITLTELVDVVAATADVCKLPLVVDMDTGFGNPLNVFRSVRSLERAGASALQIEDQTFPKRCGHFGGKSVIPAADMAAKIKAAVDARRSEDLLIIARTDARGVEGLSSAIDRAHMYADAGADATFVEAPVSVDELRAIASSIDVPQVANMVVGGQTPLLSVAELHKIGFAMVLYANASLQAAIHAVHHVLGTLLREGSLENVMNLLASFEQRQKTVKKSNWDELETRYR